MKRFLTTALLLTIGAALGAQEFHSLWIVPKKTEIGEAGPVGAGRVCATENGWEFSIPVGRIPAGSYVEWDFTVSAKHDAPEYYAVEYYDQGRWKTDGIVKCTLTADSSKEFTTQLRTLRFEDAIGRGNLQLRLRPVTEGKGLPKFPNSDNVAASVRFLGTQAPADTTRILCIGNSFTYVSQSAWMLKELAWSQGHFLDLQAALKGGRTFAQHLALSVTDEKIREGRYDLVFLQNQSQTNAWYWQDRKGNAQLLDDAVALSGKVRRWSPTARMVFEATWAYPGHENGGFASVDEFDEFLWKGTSKMAKVCKGEVSPIGKAFAVCRAERPDIPMYSDDDKHQSAYGAYLKACVNYLVIFGGSFNDEACDCSLDPEKTLYLRDIAKRIVK